MRLVWIVLALLTAGASWLMHLFQTAAYSIWLPPTCHVTLHVLFVWNNCTSLFIFLQDKVGTCTHQHPLKKLFCLCFSTQKGTLLDRILKIAFLVLFTSSRLFCWSKNAPFDLSPLKLFLDFSSVCCRAQSWTFLLTTRHNEIFQLRSWSPALVSQYWSAPWWEFAMKCWGSFGGASLGSLTRRLKRNKGEGDVVFCLFEVTARFYSHRPALLHHCNTASIQNELVKKKKFCVLLFCPCGTNSELKLWGSNLLRWCVSPLHVSQHAGVFSQ